MSNILLTKEETDKIIFKTRRMLQELSSKPEEYNQEEFVTFGRTTLRELKEAQLGKVVELIKKDTNNNFFGMTDKFYKNLLKEAGL